MDKKLLAGCMLWLSIAQPMGCGSDRTQAPAALSPLPNVTRSPYACMSSAAVPSLSEQEVADLLAGRGLGMARAAELNGYPGPRHVLDLRRELDLDQATLERAEQLFQEMQTEAQPLGAQVVALEKALGESFAARAVDEAALPQKLEALSRLMAELRAVHLRAHVRMKAALSDQQVARYAALRGYAAADSAVPVAGSGASAHAHHHGM